MVTANGAKRSSPGTFTCSGDLCPPLAPALIAPIAMTALATLAATRTFRMTTSWSRGSVRRFGDARRQSVPCLAGTSRQALREKVSSGSTAAPVGAYTPDGDRGESRGAIHNEGG